jgi:hypothetical protein
MEREYQLMERERDQPTERERERPAYGERVCVCERFIDNQEVTER